MRGKLSASHARATNLAMVFFRSGCCDMPADVAARQAENGCVAKTWCESDWGSLGSAECEGNPDP